MNARTAAAMLEHTREEAQRISTCDASMESCHYIRQILREPYTDVQLELLADLLELLAPRIHDKDTSDELADQARWIREYVPQLRQDREAWYW